MPRIEAVVGGPMGGNTTWSVTSHYMLGSPVADYATLLSVANATMTALSASTAFKQGIATDTTVQSVKLLYYPSNTGAASLVAISTVAAFTGSNTAICPPQVSVVASLRTTAAGRSGRGRMYVPYRTSSVNPSGLLSAAAYTAVGAFVNNLKSSVIQSLSTASIAATWVVWSHKLGAGQPVSTILIGNHCDTQRRRNANDVESYTPVTVTATAALAPVGGELVEGALSKIINLTTNAVEGFVEGAVAAYDPDGDPKTD
jgi:hypothetical protein